MYYKCNFCTVIILFEQSWSIWYLCFNIFNVLLKILFVRITLCFRNFSTRTWYLTSIYFRNQVISHSFLITQVSTTLLNLLKLVETVFSLSGPTLSSSALTQLNQFYSVLPSFKPRFFTSKLYTCNIWYISHPYELIASHYIIYDDMIFRPDSLIYHLQHINID